MNESPYRIFLVLYYIYARYIYMTLPQKSCYSEQFIHLTWVHNDWWKYESRAYIRYPILQPGQWVAIPPSLLVHCTSIERYLQPGREKWFKFECHPTQEANKPLLIWPPTALLATSLAGGRDEQGVIGIVLRAPGAPGHTHSGYSLSIIYQGVHFPTIKLGAKKQGKAKCDEERNWPGGAI